MIDAISLFPTAPLDGLVAHFSARTGGVSRPPFDSLNLGFSTNDDPQHVRENRRRFCAAVGVPIDRLVVPGQSHGNEVLTVDASVAGEGALDPSRRLRGLDAVVLLEPNVYALALSADCPLIVVADPVRRCVGVAHSGWRGTVAGVIGELLGTLRTAGSDPADWVAALSPGISGCCYPVGPEVLEALAPLPGFDAAVTDAPGGRSQRGDVPNPSGTPTAGGAWLDLRRIHRAVLVDAGIAPSRVYSHSSCTSCERERFFSHRRDRGATGRSGVIVGWLG